MGEGAAYLALGWKLVPIPSGRKGPDTGDWNVAHNLIATPAQLAAALQQGPINLGLCHQPSGTCAIDVDHVEYTRLIFDEFGIDYDDIIGRGLRIFSREGRDKVIFACPDMPLMKVNWPAQGAQRNERLNIVEFRAGPNQDVLPPSIHPDGHAYQWWPGRSPRDMALPPIPEHLLQFWRALADRDTRLRDEIVALCPWRPAHLAARPQVKPRSVARHGPDVIGAFNAAHGVAELLERNGYKRRGKRYLAPGSSTGIPGVNILEGTKAFSHHGSDLIADGYAHDAFSLYTILEHGNDVSAAVSAAAQELGIDRNPPPPADALVSEGEIAGLIAAAQRRRERIDPDTGEISHAPTMGTLIPDSGTSGSLPAGLHEQTRGAFAMFVEWVLRTSSMPQPDLAVAAGVALFGAVLGGQVSGYRDCRTNFMTIGVGGTGVGKEHARTCAKMLLDAAGVAGSGTTPGVMGGEKIASAAGLMTMLSMAPHRLLLIDEFGKRLATWTAPKSHARDVPDELLTLATSAHTTVRGAQYSDARARPRADVVQPCLCIYGTTTGATLWPALSGGDVDSGLLGRLLVFSAPSKRPDEREIATIDPPPEALVEWVRQARGLCRVNPGLDAQSPVAVPLGEVAGAILGNYRLKVRDTVDRLEADPDKVQVAALWARAGEHASKLALLFAVTRYGAIGDLVDAVKARTIETDEASASLAVRLVDACMAHIEGQVGALVGDSDMHRAKKAVLAWFEAAGHRGHTRGEFKRCKELRSLDIRGQDALIDSLVRDEDLVRVDIEPAGDKGGRPRNAWVAARALSGEFTPPTVLRASQAAVVKAEAARLAGAGK